MKVGQFLKRLKFVIFDEMEVDELLEDAQPVEFVPATQPRLRRLRRLCDQPMPAEDEHEEEKEVGCWENY